MPELQDALINFETKVLHNSSFLLTDLQVLLQDDASSKSASREAQAQLFTAASKCDSESTQDELAKAIAILEHINAVYGYGNNEAENQNDIFGLTLMLKKRYFAEAKRADAAAYNSKDDVLASFNKILHGNKDFDDSGILWNRLDKISLREIKKLLAADAEFKALDPEMQKVLHSILISTRVNGSWEQYPLALALYQHLQTVYAYNPANFAAEILITEALTEQLQTTFSPSSATRRLLTQFSSIIAGNLSALGYAKWLQPGGGLFFSLVNLPQKFELTAEEQAEYFAAAQIFLPTGEICESGSGVTFGMLDHLAAKYDHQAAKRQSVQIAFASLESLAFATVTLDAALPRVLQRDCEFRVANTLDAQQGLHLIARAAATYEPRSEHHTGTRYNGGGRNISGKALAVLKHLKHSYGYCPAGFEAEIAALEKRIQANVLHDVTYESCKRAHRFPQALAQFEAGRARALAEREAQQAATGEWQEVEQPAATSRCWLGLQ